MPIYEYSCKKCGEEIEILHKVDEKPKEACPACGSRALMRKVSAAGFRLSGGGWYETDFKKDGKKNLKDDSGAPEAKSEPKADSKADSKAPAAKPVSKVAEAAKSETKPAAKAATKMPSSPSKAA